MTGLAGPPPGRPVPVLYQCGRCQAVFTVWQGEAGMDEDITLCWDCIDQLLPPKGPEPGSAEALAAYREVSNEIRELTGE